MRRALVLASSALLALVSGGLVPLWLVPARAQQGPPLQVTVSKPEDGQAFVNRDVVAVRFRVEIPDGNDTVDDLVRVTATLSRDDTQLIVACQKVYIDPADEQKPNPPGVNPPIAMNGGFDWDSTRNPSGGTLDCTGDGRLESGSLSANGTYRVKVTARARRLVGGTFTSTEKTVTRSFEVGNPPAPPTGLALSYSSERKEVTVTWKANREPDLKDYELQECYTSQARDSCDPMWKTITFLDRETTAVRVAAAEPGTYRYRLAARRDGAGEVRTSPFSTPDSDPTAITVARPRPPAKTGATSERSTTTSRPERIVETRTVVKPTRRVQRSAPQVVQRIIEEDRGFSPQLRYDPAKQPEDVLGGRALAGDEGEGSGWRRVFVPVGFGTLLLVVALQVQYLNRRLHRGLEPVPAEEVFPVRVPPPRS